MFFCLFIYFCIHDYLFSQTYKATIWGKSIRKVYLVFQFKIVFISCHIKTIFIAYCTPYLRRRVPVLFIDINLLLSVYQEIFFNIFFPSFTEFPNDTLFSQINLCKSRNEHFPRFTFYPMVSHVSSFPYGNHQLFYSPGLKITFRSSIQRVWDSLSRGDKNTECNLLFYRVGGHAAKGKVLQSTQGNEMGNYMIGGMDIIGARFIIQRDRYSY